MRRATFGHFFLTSKPYFGLDNDNFLIASTSILSARLSYQPEFSDSIQASSRLLSGNKYGGLKSTNMGFDSVKATAIVLSGSTYGRLTSFDIGFDSVKATASLLNGSVYGNLISYGMKEDSVKATATLLSGTTT